MTTRSKFPIPSPHGPKEIKVKFKIIIKKKKKKNKYN